MELKLRQDGSLRADAKKRRKQLGTNARGYWARDEVDRLSNNLELLTALRRVQKKPDPISIQVIQPKGLKAIPRKLPTFSVKLKSVDVEKTPVWMQLIPHGHGSHREAQWRFEVKTAAGNQLPVRPNPNSFRHGFRHGGGMKSDGWLTSGDYLDTVLPMADFIEIPEPGEYTVTLMYHPKLPIADITNIAELDDLIIFRSESFKLTVSKGPKLVIQDTRNDRTNVLSSVAQLPNEGLVKVVGGVYDEDDFEFLSPKSPAGRILLLNWQAVPALLDSLSDANLSRHRKAWILSLLYSITVERDLNPSSTAALPAHQGMAGKNMCSSNWSEEQRIIPSEQDALIAKWHAYRDRNLDIRESDNK